MQKTRDLSRYIVPVVALCGILALEFYFKQITYLFPSSVQLTLEVLKLKILIVKALNPFTLFVLFHTTHALREKQITLQNSELNCKIGKKC
jgi:hypothetical protein